MVLRRKRVENHWSKWRYRNLARNDVDAWKICLHSPRTNRMLWMVAKSSFHREMHTTEGPPTYTLPLRWVMTRLFSLKMSKVWENVAMGPQQYTNKACEVDPRNSSGVWRWCEGQTDRQTDRDSWNLYHSTVFTVPAFPWKTKRDMFLTPTQITPNENRHLSSSGTLTKHWHIMVYTETTWC